MNVIEIMMIIIIHWIADFVLQTDEQAKGKSSSNKWLLKHTCTYTVVWLTIGILYAIYLGDIYPMWALTKFILITFVIHTIQDYFTSRLNSKLWAKGDVHNFFVIVGFDQLLHYAQLFGTYWILFK